MHAHGTVDAHARACAAQQLQWPGRRVPLSLVSTARSVLPPLARMLLALRSSLGLKLHRNAGGVIMGELTAQVRVSIPSLPLLLLVRGRSAHSVDAAKPYESTSGWEEKSP